MAQGPVRSTLSIYLARRRGVLSAEQGRKLIQGLLEAPQHMRAALGRKDEVSAVARRWYQAEHVLFLGRGYDFPIALEGALKLKEISYAHAEGYAAGEMKHGSIALIDEKMPVVVVMPRDGQFEKTLSNVQEVKAREGRVIAVVTEGDEEAKKLADFAFEIPQVPEVITPLLTRVAVATVRVLHRRLQRHRRRAAAQFGEGR